ncbi:MAG: 2-dehydropantoate 2-reductase N-terminal domain-containing protein, partial [Phycisphaerae bacterium]
MTDGPRTFRHVAVVGPGAIGLCVAIRLAQPTGGPQVTLIDHDADRARRLGGRALWLRSETGDRKARLPVALAPATPPDLVILATKAHQAATAARAAARWIGDAVL